MPLETLSSPEWASISDAMRTRSVLQPQWPGGQEVLVDCGVVPAFWGRVVVAPYRWWHSCAMPRTRVSTTVDEGLLAQARKVAGAPSDAALLDRALGALLAQHRSAEIDRAYAAYDDRPLAEPDDWGDLASFRAAAGAS